MLKQTKYLEHIKTKLVFSVSNRHQIFYIICFLLIWPTQKEKSEITLLFPSLVLPAIDTTTSSITTTQPRHHHHLANHLHVLRGQERRLDRRRSRISSGSIHVSKSGFTPIITTIISIISLALVWPNTQNPSLFILYLNPNIENKFSKFSWIKTKFKDVWQINSCG